MGLSNYSALSDLKPDLMPSTGYLRDRGEIPQLNQGLLRELPRGASTGLRRAFEDTVSSFAGEGGDIASPVGNLNARLQHNSKYRGTLEAYDNPINRAVHTTGTVTEQVPNLWKPTITL